MNKLEKKLEEKSAVSVLTAEQKKLIDFVFKAQNLETKEQIESKPKFALMKEEDKATALKNGWDFETDGVVVIGVLEYFKIDPRQRGVVYFTKRDGKVTYSLDYNYKLSLVMKKYPDVAQIVFGIIVHTKKAYNVLRPDKPISVPANCVYEKENGIYMPDFEELIGGWSAVKYANGTFSEKFYINWNEIKFDGASSNGAANSMHTTKPTFYLRKSAQNGLLDTMFSDVIKPQGFTYDDTEVSEVIEKQANKIEFKEPEFEGAGDMFDEPAPEPAPLPEIEAVEEEIEELY